MIVEVQHKETQITPFNVEPKVNKTLLLVCPLCKKNIPLFSFKKSTVTLKILFGCTCTPEPKEIDIKDMIHKIRTSPIINDYCNEHNQIHLKYCPDCMKWLCEECLSNHPNNHDCLIDYELNAICQRHKKVFSFYCDDCSKNICVMCYSDHVYHSIIKFQEVKVPFFEKESSTLLYNNQMNQKKVERFLYDLKIQLAKYPNDSIRLNQMKKDIEEALQISKNTNEALIIFLELLSTTARLLQNHPCFQLMNIFITFLFHEYQYNYEYNQNKNVNQAYTKLKDSFIHQYSIKKKYQCNGTLLGHTDGIWHIIQLKDTRLASCSYETTIKIWNINSFSCSGTLRGHKDSVSSMIQLKDSQLASISKDKTVKLWNIFSFQCNATLLGHSNGIELLIQLNNEQLCSCSHDCSIKLWNSATLKYTATLSGHTEPVYKILQLNDGELVSLAKDKTIKFWNISTMKCRGTLIGHTDYIWSIIKLKNGQLASVSDDHTIRLWNPLTFECFCIKEMTDVFKIIQLNDGQLATRSKREIKIWDTLNMQCNTTIIGHTDTVTQIFQLTNGQLISSSKDKTIKLWSNITFQCDATLAGHSSFITDIIQLHDNQLASSSWDHTIKLWEI